MKIDFRKIPVKKGYESEEIKLVDMCKNVADAMYGHTITYEQFELGRKILKGEVVDLTEIDVAIICSCIGKETLSKEITFYIYAQSLREYLQEMLEKEKKEKENSINQ